MAGRWFQLKSKSVTEDYAKDIWRSLERMSFPLLVKFLSNYLKLER